MESSANLGTPATGGPGSTTPRSKIVSIVGACSGNLVEWYDYFIYAYLSIYFASSFFPSEDPTSQLIATAGVFAMGFFIRPLGGWLFGWVADTRGRKISMIISVSMMCAGSLLIAVMPTYQTIGVFAPALLLIARLIQGLSVGAEFGTSATYLAEIAAPNRRAFYCSFQYVTIIAGQLIAVLTVTILQKVLPAEELKAWGWRIPFVIGACGAIVVSVLRRSMQETDNSAHMKKKEAGSLRGLLKHKRAVIAVLAMTMGTSLYYYTFTIYMQKMLVLSAGFTPVTVSYIMLPALFIFMLAQPVFGMLNDRFGIRNCVLVFATCAVLFVAPLLFAIRSSGSPLTAFFLVLCGLLIMSFYTPVSGLIKAQLFPTEVRALGVGLPYAVGNALFGGTASYIALSLRSAHVEEYFFFYSATACFVCLVAVIALPNINRHGCIGGDCSIEERAGFGRRRKLARMSGTA